MDRAGTGDLRSPDVTSALIDGPTELPVGFDHPHASEQARDIAARGMILRVQVGSGVHGTSISGQDDRDEMGRAVSAAEIRLGDLRNSSSLPDKPDRAWIDRWLHRRHLEYWACHASDAAG
jgi:hypothetical protein